MNLDEVRGQFGKHFGQHEPVLLARAPGRVNLIGEHTDYNQGYVLPMAIDRALYVAAGRREDRTVQARSEAFDQTARADLSRLPTPQTLTDSVPRWFRYVIGVAALLQQARVKLPGMDLLIISELPIGGGLASSAALEVACAKAMLALADEIFELVELALLCQQAEHAYAGTPCGIMDQFACLLAHRGCALLLDCRSQLYDHLPVEQEELAFAILDPQVGHELSAGLYAERVRECQQGVAYFARFNPSVKSLREVTEKLVRRHLQEMDPTVAARCLHVVCENQRTLLAAEALKIGALHEAGALLNESHASLRDRYQVVSPQLDELVQLACRVDGVYGARMTGGGFGGCAIALLERSGVEPLRKAVRDEYEARHATPPEVIITSPARGADWRKL